MELQEIIDRLRKKARAMRTATTIFGSDAFEEILKDAAASEQAARIIQGVKQGANLASSIWRERLIISLKDFRYHEELNKASIEAAKAFADYERRIKSGKNNALNEEAKLKGDDEDGEEVELVSENEESEGTEEV